MTLKEYARKRKFTKTPEPKPGSMRNTRFARAGIRKTKGNIYVIQKHKARHLHYDLRLELDGVLKSWAVPKQPPRAKNIKRLAIQTEDHPVAYASFQGKIPEGMYGAGTVKTWDKGTFDMEERKRGKKIIVNIKGKKLKGRYCLIRFREKNWLFFKC